MHKMIRVDFLKLNTFKLDNLVSVSMRFLQSFFFVCFAYVDFSVFSQEKVIYEYPQAYWYMDSINNSEPRTNEIPLDFLDDGEYTAKIYRDAGDVDIHLIHIIIENRTVRKTDDIPHGMAPGGGPVVQLTRQ